MEYGIFNSEGMIEGDFWSFEEASSAKAERYAGCGAYVARICRDHEGQEAENCSECDEEEED